MNARPRKSGGKASKPRLKKPFPVGPDGKTANQRLREVLAAHPSLRQERDLVRRSNEILGAPLDEPQVKQQAINNLLLDKDNLQKSSLVPVLAEALGVRAVWLQMGVGSMRDTSDDVLQQVRQLTEGYGSQARKQ